MHAKKRSELYLTKLANTSSICQQITLNGSLTGAEPGLEKP